MGAESIRVLTMHREREEGMLMQQGESLCRSGGEHLGGFIVALPRRRIEDGISCRVQTGCNEIL